MRPIKWLLERGTIVICSGGGGIPTAYQENRQLHGVEAVVDKDFASELLARALEADLLLLATDVDAVCINWGGRMYSASGPQIRQSCVSTNLLKAPSAPRLKQLVNLPSSREGLPPSGL